MNLLKLALAGAATAVILTAFRDHERGRWLAPAGLGGMPEPLQPEEMPEPVLGYDGMDEDTLLDWIRAADLDEHTLRGIERYERATRDRGPVLDMLADLLG